MNNLSTLTNLIFLLSVISIDAYAAKPVQDVNVINTPTVTIANPQTSVTVDNTVANPVPVTVENSVTITNPQTSVTVDNNSVNPVPVSVENGITVTNPQTSVTVDNNNTNPVPVSVQGGSLATTKPQFIGFSTASLNGGQGVISYTNACQQDFADSHMCNSEEFLNTTSYPIVSGAGWIKPVFVPMVASTGSSGVFNAYHDASGYVHISPSGSNYGMTCNGWGSEETGRRGLFVDSNGRFNVAACNEGHSVACCK